VDGVTSAIQTQIDTKAPLASPTFTGTVVLPNSTVTAEMIASDAVTQAKIADRAVGSAELDNLTLNAQTGTSYTLVLTDAHKLVTLSNASGITLTIPTNSSVAFDIGDQVNIVQLGAGQVTVGGAGVTLRSQGSKLKLNGIYSAATLLKINTDEWVLVGNTAA
jgi:urease beta subunit